MQTEDPLEDVLQALKRYGLVDKSEVLDSLILPIQFGYPIYENGYEAVRAKALDFFSTYQNLHLVGRNAEFRHIDIDENFSSAYQLVNSLYCQIKEGASGTKQAFDNKEWPLAV